MLYVDEPVGAGFSFTDSDEGYARNLTDVGPHNLTWSSSSSSFFSFSTITRKMTFMSRANHSVRGYDQAQTQIAPGKVGTEWEAVSEKPKTPTAAEPT
ncbi:hypothetical protein HPB48_026958 [Haemaphysalis longicornis]|uniref:Uncharacterized protein n=1 Tax=Haemaphysalis longicornis TaxID=44386 RepID=A0A9J6HD68_HAELO|nr:hypothetical protein HPB48_026958 [Haemaphysalis longicornis]